MRNTLLTTIARELVLDAAERLLAQKWHTAFTLRDVGAARIKHASLYQHVPGGLTEVIALADPAIRRPHTSHILVLFLVV